MAIDFPASPTIGQTYSPTPGIVYVWTGTYWEMQQGAQPYFVMPAGIVNAYAGIVLPAGALWCDGATFNQATYPLLYAALGNKNTTPDYRGRTLIGRDDMGGTPANRVNNTGAGNSGIDGKVLGAAGGFDRMTLTIAQTPAHTHTGSGTTAGQSANHYHTGTTGGESVDHTHYISGYTSEGGSHNHDYRRPLYTTVPLAGAANKTYSYDYDTANTGSDGAHSHTVNFASGGRSVGHTHDYSTSWTSNDHAHTYSFTTSGQGGGEAHSNMQPSIVTNYIIWTGT